MLFVEYKEIGVVSVINFVVVEDNLFQQKTMSRLITKYMMKNKYEFKITTFSDYTKELEHTIQNIDNHHIYLLDFELPSATAIDVARKIRKRDWTSPIIVNSIHGGAEYNTFKQKLQILDFICKQFELEKNMFELFDICIDQLKGPNFFNFRIGGVDYNINFNKILYVYRSPSARKITVVTENNEYDMNISLAEIKKILGDNFKFSHKSCIVNTKRVEVYEWKENKIIFDNNTQTDLLSRTHKKELSSIVMV